MATLVVPDLGELEMLRLMLKAELVVDEPWHLKLFKNDYEPNRTSVIGDLVEADFAGYAAQEILRDDWSTPTTVGGVALSTYDPGPVSWVTTSGSEELFGWYLSNVAGTLLLALARFDGPVTVTTTVPVVVLPYFRLHSEVEPEP